MLSCYLNCPLFECKFGKSQFVVENQFLNEKSFYVLAIFFFRKANLKSRLPFVKTLPVLREETRASKKSVFKLSFSLGQFFFTKFCFDKKTWLDNVERSIEGFLFIRKVTQFYGLFSPWIMVRFFPWSKLHHQTFITCFFVLRLSFLQIQVVVENK